MYRAFTISAAILLLFPSISLAVPTEVVHFDVPNCDPLVVPELVDELGIAPTFSPFPDELISAVDTFTTLAACPASDDPDLPNALVEMTNLTLTPWADVWYVADPFVGVVGTSISNFDGFVDSLGLFPGHAFKIDTIGLNTPLIFESIAFDGIFAPGETWQFIIDDYFNTAGLSSALFDSVGVASASLGGPPSSGSIIAVPVPEPGTLVLLLVGATILAIRAGVRRWKR